MRKAIPAVILASVTACNGEAPQSEAMTDEDKGEWVELFNGENLDGWRGYNAEAPGEGWIVRNGAIVLDVDADTNERTAGDLITEQQYENFELELEWKLSQGGNSGIFYGVREVADQAEASGSGIEMQVLDDVRHADGQTPETSAGACYALYAPQDKMLHPVGTYNRVRLVVNEGHVEHWLNGRKVVEYEVGSDDWNERVANSKFADWEHFGQYRRGHIGLQDHTDRISFRNIRIREL